MKNKIKIAIQCYDPHAKTWDDSEYWLTNEEDLESVKADASERFRLQYCEGSIDDPNEYPVRLAQVVTTTVLTNAAETTVLEGQSVEAAEQGTSAKAGCSALWGDALSLIKQSMADAIKEIEETMECSVPWGEDGNEICMRRNKEGPEIGVTLFNENSVPIAEFYSSFDSFLDETYELYSCGNDGWGAEMIEDLELLKEKIQERIDRMNAEIEAEDLDA